MTLLYCSRARGVGLIEVLAALFVISVGLLGVAKMGGLALADSSIAARRSVAVIQAESMAASMHANNQGFWSVGAVAPTSVSIKGATITNSSLAGQTTVCLWPQTCSPTQMAAYDLQLWANQLNTALPGDAATITCSQKPNNPVSCTIKITWNENSVTLNNNSSNYGQQSPAVSYTLYVEP